MNPVSPVSGGSASPARRTSIALVVPCYNEELRLDPEQFAAFFPPGLDLRFLFVNDGSMDQTLEKLKKIRENTKSTVEILDLPKNRGKAEAVRLGMITALESPIDLVGFWDADLATDLEEIHDFCRLFQDERVEVVLGSRVKLLGRHIERRAWRHYIGRFFATAISMTLSLPVYDTQCGAKLFRADEHLLDVLSTPFLAGWMFDVEILARYISLFAGKGENAAKHFVELPINRWRDVAGSKVTFLDGLRAMADLLRIRRHYIRPLCRANLWPWPVELSGEERRPDEPRRGR